MVNGSYFACRTIRSDVSRDSSGLSCWTSLLGLGGGTGMHSFQVCRWHKVKGQLICWGGGLPFSETQVGWRNWLRGVPRIFFTFSEEKSKALFLGKKNPCSHPGWGGWPPKDSSNLNYLWIYDPKSHELYLK